MDDLGGKTPLFLETSILYFAGRQVPITLLTGFPWGWEDGAGCAKFFKESQNGKWMFFLKPTFLIQSFFEVSEISVPLALWILIAVWFFLLTLRRHRHDSTLHWKKARVGSGCPSTVEIVVHLSSGQGASHPTYFGIEPGWTWRKIDKNWYQSVAFSGLKEFWRRGIIGTTCDTRTLQIAVIENEIGALGVDGALVANAHSEAGCPKKTSRFGFVVVFRKCQADDGVIELPNGSLRWRVEERSFHSMMPSKEWKDHLWSHWTHVLPWSSVPFNSLGLLFACRLSNDFSSW